ncbi:MAG: hypothetical protein PHH26_03535 [Candidatus Thermoplasmatota archaeon]|nr:hypothetical protein [Candidatus Thermoplasmatota archaeon]
MRKIDLFIAIFAVLGTICLGAISHFASPEEAKVSQIPLLEGKAVEIECVVRQMHRLDSGGAIISARDPKNGSQRFSIFLEQCSSDFDFGDLVRATGKVVKYNGEFELYALSEKSLHIIRESASKSASLWVWELANNPGEYLGMAVEVSGVANDCGKYSFMLESGGCGISVKLQEPEHMPVEGDDISVRGQVIFDQECFRYYLGVSDAVID